MGQQGFDMARLTMGQKGLLIGGGLMFIDLFLPWQRACAFGFCASASGWGGIGIILGLVVIALLAWEGMAAAGVNLNLNVSTALIGAALGGAVVLFTLLKVIVNSEAMSFGAWIGIVLGLVIAYASWVRFNESKGAAGTAGTPPPPPPPA